MATVTDEIIDLHDRIIGKLFNTAKVGAGIQAAPTVDRGLTYNFFRFLRRPLFAGQGV